HVDLVPAGARRTLALASHRCGRNLALLRRRGAQARSSGRRQREDRPARREYSWRRGSAIHGAGARLAGGGILGRLDARGLHGGARFFLRRLRAGAGGLVAERQNEIVFSSWPGLSRPSTSCFHETKAWMPGIKPGMAKYLGETPVLNKLNEAREQLARANRMIANEGVLAAFGHVTRRHPTETSHYLMSYSRGPELVQPEDILEFTLDSQIVKLVEMRLYGERVIHGEIYKARPEVNAVCHHHASSILPFCISGAELKPVYHLGATIGEKAPFWDSRDEFGDTSLIVAKPEEGASLARALGSHWIVLMRRHGATVAGKTLEELTFRTIYTARNAAMQIQAHTLGTVLPLNAAETALAGEYNLRPGPGARAWEYWSGRLAHGDRRRAPQSRRPPRNEPSNPSANARRNTARHWPRASSR